MVDDARRPVQTYHHTDDYKSRGDYSERILIREPNGEDRGGELPRGGVESVGEPVGYQGVDGPFPVTWAYRVEI